MQINMSWPRYSFMHRSQAHPKCSSLEWNAEFIGNVHPRIITLVSVSPTFSYEKLHDDMDVERRNKKLSEWTSPANAVRNLDIS